MNVTIIAKGEIETTEGEDYFMRVRTAAGNEFNVPLSCDDRKWHSVGSIVDLSVVLCDPE